MASASRSQAGCRCEGLIGAAERQSFVYRHCHCPASLTRMGAMNGKVVGIEVRKKVVNSKAPGYREKVNWSGRVDSNHRPPRMYPFVGERLVKAISASFRNRGTTIEAEPIGITQAYCDDPARAIQWRAFVRRSGSVKRLANWCGSSPKSDSSLCRSFQRWQAGTGATASMDRDPDRSPPRRSAFSFCLAVLTKSDT